MAVLALCGIVWQCWCFVALCGIVGVLCHCVAVLAFCGIVWYVWQCWRFYRVALSAYRFLFFVVVLLFDGDRMILCLFNVP